MFCLHLLHSAALGLVSFAQIIAAGKSKGRTLRRTSNPLGLNFVQPRFCFVLRQVAAITFQKMLLGIDKGLSGNSDRF